MGPADNRPHGDPAEIAGNGSQAGCNRQDYRHLRSGLWAGGVQTLAAAIYSCLRPSSKGIEKIEKHLALVSSRIARCCEMAGRLIANHSAKEISCSSPSTSQSNNSRE